jgi:5-methylcytosine-specific restriction enzyme A
LNETDVLERRPLVYARHDQNDSPERGYYVLYLFHVSESIVHLSLNQGTTAIREEFGATARQVLSARAAFIRERLPDFALRLSATQIALESNARLPGDYAAGHALGLTYSLDGLPDEQTLAADLRSTLQAYRALTFRGGLDTEPETEVVSLEAPRNRGFYFA